MLKKFKLAYNPYFHIPFLLWVVVGGILAYSFNKKELFAAVNTHYTPIADFLMYHITYMGQPEVIIPTLIALMFIPVFRTKWYFTAAVLGNITPLVMQQWLKRLFHSPRPLLYFNGDPWIHYLHQWPELTRNSFPSGHSQGAFSFFCFLTLLLPARYSKVGLLFFTLALMVCYSRLYLAAHFFEDVYTGSIIGATTTTLIFSLVSSYRPVKKEKTIIAE